MSRGKNGNKEARKPKKAPPKALPLPAASTPPLGASIPPAPPKGR